MRRPLTKLQKRPVGLLKQKSLQFALKLLIHVRCFGPSYQGVICSKKLDRRHENSVDQMLQCLSGVWQLIWDVLVPHIKG